MGEPHRARRPDERARTVHGENVGRELRQDHHGRDGGKLTDVTAGMHLLLGLSLDRQRVIAVVGVIPGRRPEGDR